MRFEVVIEMLKRHEGLRLKPYHCTAGRLTIGYGRNIQDVGIAHEEAEFMLIADILRCENELQGIFKDFNLLSENRKAALIDMMFNLGMTRFLGFKKMVKAIEDGDWNAASTEALSSKWAKQVGNRAVEIAKMLRKG